MRGCPFDSMSFNNEGVNLKKLMINPKEDLIFDLKVREMCKWCKRYGKKATCFPYIESVEFYSNLLPKYNNGTIFYDFFLTSDKNKEQIGKESSLMIHRKIISERHRLFFEGHYLIIGFGAGSCKLCDKCSFPCRLPAKALIPIEATGMDVVKVMKKFGVEVKFPVEKLTYICRIGAIFYD